VISFSQHHVNGLDLAATPLGYLMKQNPGVPDQRQGAHLSRIRITGAPLALQTMYTLSGEDGSWDAVCPLRRRKQGSPAAGASPYDSQFRSCSHHAELACQMKGRHYTYSTVTFESGLNQSLEC
jgi:hypothetical protein